MPTDFRMLSASPQASTAELRAWGAAISSMIAAMGLVKTADTGQIDWNTAGPAPAAGQSLAVGYEIWRFNDALQATAPVFLRIDYGVGSGLGGTNLNYRFGTGTNGAGTLSGASSTVSTGGPVSYAAGTVLPAFCSGSPSRLALVTQWGSNNVTPLILAERTHDANGNPTADGVVAFSVSQGGGNMNPSSVVMALSGTPQGGGAALSPNYGLPSLGAKTVISPYLAPIGKPLFATWGIYPKASLGPLVPVSLKHLGAIRKMMPIGDFGGLFSTGGWSQGGGGAMAILWE